MNKTFVVGDIHGNLAALKQCIERSGINKEDDVLIQLGDVADGYPQVPECVEELLTFKNLISLRGNHDVWCWNWFELGEAPTIWLSQGGRSTYESYVEQKLQESPIHKKFWNDQKDYYIDDQNRLFVHGGFDLTYGFEWSKTAELNLRNATELHWNRDCAEYNEKSWPKVAKKHLDEFKEIFIGHTAHNTTSFNGPGKRNIWNLDTGAGFKGKLTILDVDTKEFWQSDPASLLYPGYRGR